MITLQEEQEELSTGSVSFITTPEGADIYLDDIYQEIKTPCIVDNVPIGIHSFKLELNDYNTIFGNIDIKENQLIYIIIEMTSLIENTGSLYIVTEPIGAVVYIDDVIIDDKTPLFINNITPTSYVIKILLDEYEDYVKIININVDEMLYLDIMLNKIEVQESILDYSKITFGILSLIGLLGMMKIISNKI